MYHFILGLQTEMSFLRLSVVRGLLVWNLGVRTSTSDALCQLFSGSLFLILFLQRANFSFLRTPLRDFLLFESVSSMFLEFARSFLLEQCGHQMERYLQAPAVWASLGAWRRCLFGGCLPPMSAVWPGRQWRSYDGFEFSIMYLCYQYRVRYRAIATARDWRWPARPP